ncbi:interferon alpha/beta receptor 1-like isoform 1-T1 [Leptodactylus fuscus]|uniref:interferon alpha/beta receptor 1-like n=1 Tax=Leptodactylus fuscus TaxID=238119 RepID=UPI003F4F37AA
MARRLLSLLLPATWMVLMAAVADETESPPPSFHVLFRDGLVIVSISSSEHMFTVTLRRNDSTEEISENPNVRNYIIPPNNIFPEQTYCVKVKVFNTGIFGPEECFTAPAKTPPDNLRMEAEDLTYLLKWDWDFVRSPNATFSVDYCRNINGGKQCRAIKGCENMTATQCDCSQLSFIGRHIVRVSVYDGQTQEKSFSAIEFKPSQDTVPSPPKNVTMRILGNELFINVSDPEGFKNYEIKGICSWQTHVEINSTHGKVPPLEGAQLFFKLKSIEASTTYCAKAKKKCRNNTRSSRYSEVFCITTDPKSYLVAWIAGFTLFGIVLISVVLYVCFCPLKRFIKKIFFPSNKLPSSIEKGFGESPLDCIKYPFLLHEEETTDQCYIVQNANTEDLVQNNSKERSQTSVQDSGNYTGESNTTGESIAPSE